MSLDENKVERAVDRLNAVLPLHSQHNKLGALAARLYRELLLSFVKQGRVLTDDEMMEIVEGECAALVELKATDLVVCDSNSEIYGVYPFTMEQRVHRLTLNGFTVHAMCALDALAVSCVSGVPVVINSQCHVTRMPLHFNQNGCQFYNKQQLRDVFFALDWDAASSCCSCADSLCGEMIFLRGADTVGAWQSNNSNNREVFTLEEAVIFARKFFQPLWPSAAS